MKKESNHNYIQFITAVKTAQESKNFDALYATMCEIFQLNSIHPSAKEYIESTINMEHVAGPLYFDGFGKSHKGVSLINHYYVDTHIPKDKFLPAIQFAYSPSGHEYYLFLESGQVVGGHHDTLWVHHFDHVFSKSNRNFDRALRKFLSTYGLETYTYTQFAKMQRICREEYGINSAKEFPGALKGDDFVKILTESGKDEDGKIVCYLDDIVLSDFLEGMIDCFDDFFI